MSRLYLAVDQSTGRNSAVGLALVEPKTLTILDARELRPRFKSPITEARLWDLAQQFDEWFTPIYEECRSTNTKLTVTFEQFVMRGKSGQSLAWAVGAFISCVPFDEDIIDVVHTNNLVAKKNSFGSGKADKEQVALGLKSIFGSNKDSLDLITKLSDNGMDDAIDAISLALAASVKIRTTIVKGSRRRSK